MYSIVIGSFKELGSIDLAGASPVPNSNEPRQSKRVCLRFQQSEGEVV